MPTKKSPSFRRNFLSWLRFQRFQNNYSLLETFFLNICGIANDRIAPKTWCIWGITGRLCESLSWRYCAAGSGHLRRVRAFRTGKHGLGSHASTWCPVSQSWVSLTPCVAVVYQPETRCHCRRTLYPCSNLHSVVGKARLNNLYSAKLVCLVAASVICLLSPPVNYLFTYSYQSQWLSWCICV